MACFCDACSHVCLLVLVVDSEVLQVRRCPYLANCEYCQCKRSILVVTQPTYFQLARQSPLGNICVVREALTSRLFARNRIETAISAPAPDCQPEQASPYTMKVSMRQVCLIWRTEVIADNGEADQ